jgi:hypothetical protein
MFINSHGPGKIQFLHKSKTEQYIMGSDCLIHLESGCSGKQMGSKRLIMKTQCTNALASHCKKKPTCYWGNCFTQFFNMYAAVMHIYKLHSEMNCRRIERWNSYAVLVYPQLLNKVTCYSFSGSVHMT